MGTRAPHEQFILEHERSQVSPYDQVMMNYEHTDLFDSLAPTTMARQYANLDYVDHTVGAYVINSMIPPEQYVANGCGNRGHFVPTSNIIGVNDHSRLMTTHMAMEDNASKYSTIGYHHEEEELLVHTRGKRKMSGKNEDGVKKMRMIEFLPSAPRRRPKESEFALGERPSFAPRSSMALDLDLSLKMSGGDQSRLGVGESPSSSSDGPRSSMALDLTIKL
ncbi:hypothetical protein ABZP36_016171 [Zizania latifolia]